MWALVRSYEGQRPSTHHSRESQWWKPKQRWVRIQADKISCKSLCTPMRGEPYGFGKGYQWPTQDCFLNAIQQIGVVNIANSAAGIVDCRTRPRAPRNTGQSIRQAGPLIDANRAVLELRKSLGQSSPLLHAKSIWHSYAGAQSSEDAVIHELHSRLKKTLRRVRSDRRFRTHRHKRFLFEQIRSLGW